MSSIFGLEFSGGLVGVWGHGGRVVGLSFHKGMSCLFCWYLKLWVERLISGAVSIYGLRRSSRDPYKLANFRSFTCVCVVLLCSFVISICCCLLCCVRGLVVCCQLHILYLYPDSITHVLLPFCV